MDADPKDSGFDQSLATPGDLAEFAALLGHVFSTREPPAVAAGFPAQKIEALSRIFGAKSIQEGLSVIARSRQTGDVIGVVLAHDFAIPPPEEIDPLIPVFAPLLVFLEQLENAYPDAGTAAAGEVLHVFMIAVADGWSGKGVAQQLVQACLRNGAERGYRTAFTEATSDVSRNVFRKAGFEERHFARYDAFEFEGTHPFASIRDSAGCALMDISLT